MSASVSYEALKIHILDDFRKRNKLQVFLVKLKLYIEFNKKKVLKRFRKTLFTTTYLKNAVFN
jgi:hypothetical protein